MIKINRRSGYSDSLRNYKIIIDNKYVGNISDGEVKCFQVEEGQHNIYLKIDWCRSNKVDFDVLGNEVIEFDCGSSLKGIKMFLCLIYITLLKNKYLWLKRC